MECVAPTRAHRPLLPRLFVGRCYYCGAKVTPLALTCVPCRPLWDADPLGAPARLPAEAV